MHCRQQRIEIALQRAFQSAHSRSLAPAGTSPCGTLLILVGSWAAQTKRNALGPALGASLPVIPTAGALRPGTPPAPWCCGANEAACAESLLGALTQAAVVAA